jgi:hypothetical protein
MVSKNELESCKLKGKDAFGGEMEYYHYVTACFFKGNNINLRQLALGVVRVSVMARNQVRLLTIVAEFQNRNGQEV